MMNNFDEESGENDTRILLVDLAEILSTYGNVSRLQIVQQLEKTPSDFSDLKEITKLSKTAISHHLEKLTRNGVIVKTSRGKYKLTEDGFEFYSAVVGTYSLSQRKIDLENKKRADHIQGFYSGSKDKKDDLVVTFERLMPMRVVSFQAISNTPENDAWNLLRDW
ncbi:MAG: ArsR/SmtB family transcription factor, partial [Candidatus Heimdallarchaeota archaeon]